MGVNVDVNDDVVVDAVVEGDGDGDGDVQATTNDYRDNFVSIATTLPSSTIARRCWISGRLSSARALPRYRAGAVWLSLVWGV